MAKITANDNGRQAEDLLKQGIGELAGAFNLCDCRPWAFPPKTRERAMGLMKEIYALFQEGGFKPHTGPVLEGDAHFQKFMQQVIGKRRSTRSNR